MSGNSRPLAPSLCGGPLKAPDHEQNGPGQVFAHLVVIVELMLTVAGCFFGMTYGISWRTASIFGADFLPDTLVLTYFNLSASSCRLLLRPWPSSPTLWRRAA